MSDDRFIWLEASLEARSYRQMYALALEIGCSDAASPELRKAAHKVVRLLQGVIELPIADAKLLARASKKFRKLAVIRPNKWR